ncbi:hypothetical protein [Trinickia sp. EG282A]|uniref:hypothetical protein n=1 Tax=Trinickia sp. EG282A TaxID=3237013 RepID=UPI0034D1D219
MLIDAGKTPWHRLSRDFDGFTLCAQVWERGGQRSGDVSGNASVELGQNNFAGRQVPVNA